MTKLQSDQQGSDLMQHTARDLQTTNYIQI